MASAKPNLKEEIIALKRERILAAGVELFYQRGYEHTTLDAVAEQISVTKPFIYSYFESKADLLAEICSRAISRSIAALERVATYTDKSCTEKLSVFSKDFIRTVLLNQEYVAILMREEMNLRAEDRVRINNLRRQFDSDLTHLLDAGVTTGEFAVDDTHLAALAIGGLVSWTYVWYRPHGKLSLDQMADQLANLVLAVAGSRAIAKHTLVGEESVAPRTSRTAAELR